MKKTISTIITLLMLFIALPAHADKITIVADPWLPYIGEEGTQEYGFMLEIVMETLKGAGHEIDFKNLDWDTAVEEARKGNYNAIIGAYKDDAPDFVFPENELGMGASHFFVLKGNTWRYNGIESLKGKKIGIMSGYAYTPELDAYFNAGANVVKATKLIDLLQMLSEKKIDTLIEDYNVFMLLAMNSYMMEDITDAGSASESIPLYVAFSPSNPKSETYAKIVSDGVEKLRKSGALKSIMNRYGLEDWKK